MKEFGLDGIRERFLALDEELLALGYGAVRFDVVVAGSCGLICQHAIQAARMTTDIDLVDPPEEIVPLLEKYDINCDMDTFRFVFPDSWRSRVVDSGIGCSCMNVRLMSVEDIFVAKLIAYRDKDIDDLPGIVASGKLDVDRLDRIVTSRYDVGLNLPDGLTHDNLVKRYRDAMEDAGVRVPGQAPRESGRERIRRMRQEMEERRMQRLGARMDRKDRGAR